MSPLAMVAGASTEMEVNCASVIVTFVEVEISPKFAVIVNSPWIPVVWMSPVSCAMEREPEFLKVTSLVISLEVPSE